MNKKIRLLSSFFLFFLVVLFALPQDTILIKNGTIVPVVGKITENGSLLIQKGKIVKIGTNISAPSDAKIIDAKGMYVYPGMVALMTAIGVSGYPGAGNDQNEIGVVTPQMDPYMAFNPADNSFDVTRIGGVTTVHTTSGSRNVITGKSIVVNLDGTLPSDMVIQKYTAQIFNVRAKERNKYPSTLSGTVTLIKDKLYQAKLYAEKMKKPMEKSEGNKDTQQKRDLEMEALVPVVTGKVRAIFVTNNEVTLRNAISIIKEYKLKGIVQASRGIHKFVDELAKEKIPVLWAGSTTTPQRWEPFDLYYRTAGMLAEKGVMFTFITGGMGGNSSNVRNLPFPAALSVAHGLSEEEAIKALTINPAKILGVDDMVGSLEVGKVANVVIWSESPIQMRSKIHSVIIKGNIIPLTSFQTRLRDKFEKIVKERMKKNR